MSQSVTFTGASFEIQTINNDPTNKLAITRPRDPVGPDERRFFFRNSDRTTIERLDFSFREGVQNNLFLEVSSKTILSARNSSFSFGSLGDTLIIGGSESNTYSMFDGNNSVEIRGASVRDNIGFGAGADRLVFGGSIANTTVNLGGDQAQDRITISGWRPSVTGFVVKGANTGDLLVVGSTIYSYNESSDKWINSSGKAYKNISSS